MATSMTGNKGPYSGQKVGGNKIRQYAKFDPQQMGVYNDMYNNVGPDSYLNRLAAGDQSFFEEMEAPAMRQFAALSGENASRFSQGGGGQGAMSARHGSGFQNYQNAATSNFTQDLQSKRQALQRQAIMDLSGLQHQLLGEEPYETYLEPRKKKEAWWQKAAPYAGAIIGGVTGGPPGAIQGYQTGNAIRNATGGGGGGGAGGGGGNLPNSWSSFAIENLPGGV